jgi:hypothetical protein
MEMNREDKTTYLNLNKKLFFRILLLILLGFVCYQLQRRLVHFDAIVLKNPLLLVVAMLLIPINFLLEFLKFKTTMNERGMNHVQLLRSLFCQGIIVSFFTPSLLANSFGRINFSDWTKNSEILAGSLVQNMAQFGVSIGFAAVSLFFLDTGSFAFLRYLFIPLGIGCYLFYFFGQHLFRTAYSKYFQKFKSSFNLTKDRIPVLFYSFVRYLVFSAQFHLLLAAFGMEFKFIQIFVLMLSYGIITLSPSILFGKIVIRESVSVAVFSTFGFPAECVLVTAFATWVFNVVVPMLFSLIYLAIRK